MANKHTQAVRLQKAIGTPCAYCKRPMSMTKPGLLPTRDHVWPRSKGGKYTIWACYDCNHIKGAMTPEEWTAYMAAFPHWWGGVPKESKREFHELRRHSQGIEGEVSAGMEQLAGYAGSQEDYRAA
jgi:hypothetical protein